MRSILLLLPVLSAVCGYKILCVFPIPSPSHNILAKGVVTALLKAGHQVTWVTPYPSKNEDKNLRIIPSGTEMLGQVHNMADPKVANQGLSFVLEFARNISRVALNNELLRNVLTNEQFDAVCTEWFFSPLDSGIAAIQGVPWIMLNSMPYNPMVEGIIDEVRSLATIPLITNDAPVPMNLLQRLTNTVMYVGMMFVEITNALSIEADYTSIFASLAAARGLPLTPLAQARQNVSILLVNSHPSIASVSAAPANAIPIGGYHIPEYVAPLPEDLKTIMDNSQKGVIYFSLGSVVKSANLPEHTLKDLVTILGSLPYTVLWKFEKEFSGLPKNVHVRPWMPQNSILAHPKLKLFITHGGMLSCLEAIHFGVPVLAVPVFGDQPGNAARATRAGYATTVPFSHDMGKNLKEKLDEMLGDDKYFKRAKYLSKLFRNREVSPTKLISHYVEVAIESKGAYHLRSPSHLYSWHERWMLDQAAIVLAVLYLLVVVMKKLLSLCSSGKKEKRKQKKN